MHKSIGTLVKSLSRVLPIRSYLELVRLAGQAVNLVKYRDAYTFQQVAVELSSQCNRKCWYCPNKLGTYPKGQDMSDEIFTKILADLRAINWRGGFCFHYMNEPLMREDIVERVAQVRKDLPKAMPLVISNGDYLTEDLMERLIKAGMFRATVTRHPPFSPNWDVRMAKIEARWPNYIRLHSLYEVYNSGGLITELDQLEPVKIVKPSCISTLCSLPIRYDGNVTVCCCDYYREVSMGNVLDYSVWEIWSNPQFVEVRRRLRGGDRMFKMCRGCSQMSRTSLLTGSKHTKIDEEMSAKFQVSGRE
jgi:cyclic pyranopterin phosphate synthase